jgi:hypothetical protein
MRPAGRSRPADHAGILALRDRRWLPALPLLLVAPRIALQYEAQLKQVLRGM